MADPYSIGPDRVPNESGPYHDQWDAEYKRDWATAIALVLLLVGGLALLIYSSGDQRTAAMNDDVTTGQSTRPTPISPIPPAPHQ